MSKRELLDNLLQSIPDYQIDIVYDTVTGIIKILDDAEDDAFCLALAQKALKDDDNTRFSMEDVMKECGISNDDLQN